MKSHQKPLYDKARADSLRRREASSEQKNRLKFALLLENLGSCSRLVDIGCGWGQFLQLALPYVNEVWGVDESPDRIKDTRRVCPDAKLVICRADQLELPDAYFDVAVTSQMLHEVKLFGSQAELQNVLQEIRRILTEGGRYFLLDHQNAGEGDITVKLPLEKLDRLIEFEHKFTYYPAKHVDIDTGVIRISRRCLQDFLTKTWALNSPMESMEMNETHNVFEQKRITGFIQTMGFTIDKWIAFSDICEDLKHAGGKLLAGAPWFRRFLLISTKTSASSHM